MLEQILLLSGIRLESRAGLADIVQGGPESEQPASRVFVEVEQSGEPIPGGGGKVVAPECQCGIAGVHQVEEERVPSVGVLL